MNKLKQAVTECDTATRETPSGEHAITETPASTPVAPATVKESDADPPSIAKRRKHTLLGIASCVMLGIAAPWLAGVGFVAYAVFEEILGLAEPQARVGLWPLVLVAQLIILVMFVVIWIGLSLGVLGLFSVDKNRVTARIGIVLHALILLGLAFCQLLFQRF